MRNLRLYYSLKTILPRSLQIRLRQASARRKRRHVADVWPILESAGRAPAGWKGWPDGKQFALVLTHDVETARGVDRCRMIMDIEERLGFRSAFNFIPERYKVPADLRQEMVRRGFEVGVHGLYHDLSLFRSEKEFKRQSQDINRYLKDWGAVGFRSPYMIKNLKWIRDYLDIEYDSSTFDTDPFEPQPDGVGTIFPFIVDGEKGGRPGYVELPCTLPQDLNLFVLLGETGIDVWKKKLDWIVDHGGMALFDTHPDYMQPGAERTADEYPVQYYNDFLEHMRICHVGCYWHVLPREVARYVLTRSDMVDKKTLRRSCMVAYAFYDGDNRIRRYAETLARRGDDVEAIGLRQSGQAAEGLVNGVKVSRIQFRKRDESGPFVYLARILRFWLKSSAILAWRHWRSPYTLVHIHSVPDFEVFAAWFPKLLGAKVILDIHDIVPEFYASKFGVDRDCLVSRALRLIERASCGFAHHVISANHLWHKVLTQRAVPNDKCTVFLNYVDKAIFYPRPRTRKDDRFIIVYPGGLQKHQGLDIVVRAMVIIRREVPNAELHIYGDGNQKGALHRLIEELGLLQVVFLHPEVALHEVSEILANADLGVVPKLAEGFGNEAYSTKILEFMAQGLPVVVSRTKIDSYYFDDRTVRFFDSGNVVNLAEAVVSLVKDPEARSALSRNGAAYLETQYWDTHQQEYLDLVDSLITKSR